MGAGAGDQLGSQAASRVGDQGGAGVDGHTGKSWGEEVVSPGRRGHVLSWSGQPM